MGSLNPRPQETNNNNNLLSEVNSDGNSGSRDGSNGGVNIDDTSEDGTVNSIFTSTSTVRDGSDGDGRQERWDGSHRIAERHITLASKSVHRLEQNSIWTNCTAGVSSCFGRCGTAAADAETDAVDD